MHEWRENLKPNGEYSGTVKGLENWVILDARTSEEEKRKKERAE